MAFEDVLATEAYIMGAEGVSEKAYEDAYYYSTGFGHLIKQGEDHLLEKKVSFGEARQMMHKDIADFQSRFLPRAQKMGLKQEQITALTGFAYNTGGSLIPKVLDLMGSGDMTGAALLMAKKNTTKGVVSKDLVLRRNWEAFQTTGVVLGDFGRYASAEQAGSHIGKKNGVNVFTSVGDTISDAVTEVTTTISNAGTNAIRGAKQLWAVGSRAIDRMTHQDITANSYEAVAAGINNVSRRLSDMGSGLSEEGWADRLRKEGSGRWQA